MANLMSKYNSNRRFTFEASEDMPFMSLEEVYAKHGADAVIPLRALYINNKSKYGPAPVAITDFAFINLPKHMLSTVEDMINDKEVVAYINAGNAGFQVTQYVPRNYPDRIAYSVEWIDAV